MAVDFWADAEVIHTYTRAQALEDGVLIDVSAVAREAGIHWPTTLTAAAWADTVAWDVDADKRKQQFTGQDETGRLWDVLNLAVHTIRVRARAAVVAPTPPGTRVPFTVYRVPPTGRGVQPRKVTLHIVVAAGDNGEPTFVIMQPQED